MLDASKSYHADGQRVHDPLYAVTLVAQGHRRHLHLDGLGGFAREGFDDVLQLPDVARPAVPLQSLDHPLRDA